MRAYLQDVANLWDELTFTPLELRQTQDSVIGFGRIEAHGANAMTASILWIVRLQDGQLSSIEVFQAPEHDTAERCRPPAERCGDQVLMSAARERRAERAGSLTGAACIARSRTSRQDMPSLSSAGAPIRIAVATSTACRITP